jgi:hypothetical protein
MNENDPYFKIFDLSFSLYKIRELVLGAQSHIIEGKSQQAATLLERDL